VLTLGGLAAALALVGYGWLAVRLAEWALRSPLPRGFERGGAILAAGLSLGPALACALIFALGPLERAEGRAFVGLGLLALGACAALDFAGRRTAPREPAAPGGGWPARALGALALALGGFALFYASAMPMHVFDPLYHFAYKGSVLYHEGFAEEAFLAVPADRPEYARLGRVMTHPNYPPGLPVLHAIVGWAHGSLDRDATRPLFALYAWLPALLFYGRLRQRGRTIAGLAAVAWLSLPILYYTRTPFEYVDWRSDLGQGPSEAQFLASWNFSFGLLADNLRAFFSGAGFLPDGWVLDGAGDLPVGALCAAGLCLAGGGVGAARLALGGLCLGGACLAKNEGLPLAALAILAFALRQLLVLRPGLAAASRRLALAALPCLLLTLPWLAWRGRIPSIDEDYPRAVLGMLGLGPPLPGAGSDNLAPANLADGLARAPVVLLGFVTSFVHLLRWNLLWPLCLGAPLWWLLRRPRALWNHPGLPLLLFLSGGLSLYFLILLVTPWDLAVLYTTVIPDRLLLHLFPAALLLAAELTWPLPGELDPRPERTRSRSATGTDRDE
jgi:hypothetical protein